MNRDTVTFRNGRIFDGARLYDDYAICFENGQRTAFGPTSEIADRGTVVDLGGDILSPGFVDLQVNGGDGIMFNDDPSVETLRRMSSAHRKLGVTQFLPTLITDTPEKTHAAIAATIKAIDEGVPGVFGLHLEGPHLSVARKGAHEGKLIRKMTDEDLDALITAVGVLPCLKVTIAPENVTEDAVARLADAGVLVSLGHTDASFSTCLRYFDAGARCVTHLFNAMSQLGNREPGLVGAALSSGTASTGLIADGIHVHPETMRAAWAAKAGSAKVFLVSDAMAVAGSSKTEFKLNGRTICRQHGRLTLEDGTLAGADLDLTSAITTMVEQVGVPLEAALQAATHSPAALADASLVGPGAQNCQITDMIRISQDLKKVSLLA